MSEEKGRGFTPSCCSNETRAALLGPDVPPHEREHRARLLARLDEKVAREGRYRAPEDPDGAVQFLPYKSLKGWDLLVREEVRRANETEP